MPTLLTKHWMGWLTPENIYTWLHKTIQENNNENELIVFSVPKNKFNSLTTKIEQLIQNELEQCNQ